MRTPLTLAGLTLLATLNGCSDSSTSSDNASEPSPQTTLAPPSETGILQVATRNGPTTYFIDRHQQPAGPEHDLIKAFADTQEWALEWTVYDSTSAVLEAINQGEAHMAAAGLTHLPSRSDTLTEGPVHTRINEQLVCHRDLSPMPRSPEEMADIEIVVTADSSYVEALEQLASEHEGITYEQDDQRTTELLLSAVAEKHWIAPSPTPTLFRWFVATFQVLKLLLS
ncbi:transporter substrate-binding domain-containing protein [Vreelandella azerica]|uniref:transporter substrate-binding domain-containing protein n=1 Tax=Vreelandella azerica TaxID=2732867 RepID=UPI001C103FD2|nr:transporter substrate-binding domain-containing protein [Halomonas azerica]